MKLIGLRLNNEKFLKKYATKDDAMIMKIFRLLRASVSYLKDKDKATADEVTRLVNKFSEVLGAREVAEAGEQTKTAFDISKADTKYVNANVNQDILKLVQRVESGLAKKNELIDLGVVAESTALDIKQLTKIDPTGFKIVIEARLIEHILNDHGKKGKTDKTMSDYNNIAKMEYALRNYDTISRGKNTTAYKNVVDGKTQGAQTVLYEKNIGDKSYYVVQAAPDTKAKTLYIVSVFIGKSGYKKEAQQFAIENNHGATSEIGTANTSNNSILQKSDLSTGLEKKVDGKRDLAQKVAMKSIKIKNPLS